MFTRTNSVAEIIENLIVSTQTSIDAALYRFNSQRLARALLDAHQRGVEIRLVTDRCKYEKSQATRNLLGQCAFPFRLTHGRDGANSKMHHKFTVLDGTLVITGSYNWTFASEERNHENILLLRQPRLIGIYRQEFETLWKSSKPPDSIEDGSKK